VVVVHLTKWRKYRVVRCPFLQKRSKYEAHP
jgi:hypothetical protein